MNYNNLCFKCFFEKSSPEAVCPNCGYQHISNANEANCLSPGTLLKNRYIVGVPLGVGGFGITYKCLDTQIGGICAIKEYFPSSFARRTRPSKLVTVMDSNIERYKKLLNGFVKEANLVKKLRHRNIVSIYDSFFENNTAYYAMEYCDGIDLRKYTNNFTRKLSYDEGINILFQVMNGLEYIHSRKILHRDIAPDNIYITKNNTIKILDFGAARSEMEQSNKELSVIIKVGYAPIEQYGGRGKQGPYTDIYALGATFYHLFTSRMPVESTQRISGDMLEDFSRLRPDLPDNLKYCIEKAMVLTVAGRIADIAEMKRILGLENVSTAPASKDKSRSSQNSLGGHNGPGERSSNVGNRAVQNAGQTFKASLAIRMGAYILDLFIWAAFYMVFVLFTGALEAVILFPIVFTIVNTLSEAMTSKTLGKAIFRLCVKSKTRAKISFGQALGRNIIKLLLIFVVLFSKDNELLEDRATNSIVCIER